MNPDKAETNRHKFHQWGHQLFKILCVNLLASIALHWAWKSIAHEILGLNALRYSDAASLMFALSAIVITSAFCWSEINKRQTA